MDLKEWINQKLGSDISPDEFLEIYSGVLNAVLKSFNPKDFPNSTIELITDLLSIKESFSRIVFHNREMRNELNGFLIDIEQRLIQFQAETQATQSPLFLSFQRKDFVSAREVLKKKVLDVGFAYKNSTLTRLDNFRKVLRLIGVIGVWEKKNEKKKVQ